MRLFPGRATPQKTDLLQGTLDMLVLKTLQLEPMHGWGIAQRIGQISGEVLRVEQGSLYPALHRLEMQGLIAAEWDTTENNRRARFYRLRPAGRKRLAEESENWDRVSSAIARVMAAIDGRGPQPVPRGGTGVPLTHRPGRGPRSPQPSLRGA